ncbi:MAG: hypothetical protein E5W38_09140 [Mesorhizobium sp.]|uniref:hypothetical protein n=1 Tax=unclassified Mesorhizobium TaxID=325217 RepID=UPI000F75241E|nr:MULTISPECIES: hypothetical protein [unclassified Mesorhizobium]RWD82291.1 MAG: hypothetical protein EOS38_27290 [Mesorhizobium sp.]AZO24478.1 hypothetical protein EJ070_29860 [Mesorhizobium sp. M1E.F.Ca.ET.045.02.1.1]RUW33847.1 hypothetical protein EOA38_11915 [Mesorhizobium sp. M1E.F.Ca.ET.041.01.1.1]RUW84082.1 hypothetical protein EOA29_10685 [Mesorhizobium sp. M1E.F.Ca.ET.063.01.1.1]TIU33486.1 MAG: hypothetical protein E5W38_09140 [Mesorhizobium sp.]
MVRAIAIAILAAGIVGLPAMAAEYWVARDAVSKQCEIVPKKPDGTLVIDLGKKKYASEGEARKAMEALPDCREK